MTFKLTFRFTRADYSTEAKTDIDRVIKMTLQEKLDDKNIKFSRIYTPNRNTVKVIFFSDEELNKVFENEDFFRAAFLKPRMSISMKASRTVFCGGFDPTLLDNYNKGEIKYELEAHRWEVKDVFIARSGRSFKIEFKTREQAKDFITSNNTSIGGIIIKQEHKEFEVDPVISQCWGCGELNPDHDSNDCWLPIRCLKCGVFGHRFF